MSDVPDIVTRLTPTTVNFTEVVATPLPLADAPEDPTDEPSTLTSTATAEPARKVCAVNLTDWPTFAVNEVAVIL